MDYIRKNAPKATIRQCLTAWLQGQRGQLYRLRKFLRNGSYSKRDRRTARTSRLDARPPPKPWSTLHQLTSLSPVTSATISHIISGRIEATKHISVPRTWAVELLMPWSLIAKSALGRSGLSTIFSKTNNRSNLGYVLILRSPDPSSGILHRSTDQLMVPLRNVNPFRADWSIADRRPGPPGGQLIGGEVLRPVLIETARRRPRPRMTKDGFTRKKGRDGPLHAPQPRSPSLSTSSFISSPPPPAPRSRRQSPSYREVITHHRYIDHGYSSAAKMRPSAGFDEGEEKTQVQKNAEAAVNDFLATFSTLYNDVPPEERTKVLDSVKVPEQGEQSESESESEEYVSRQVIKSERSSLIRSYDDVL